MSQLVLSACLVLTHCHLSLALQLAKLTKPKFTDSCRIVGQDSSVRIANRYGLDDQGIESRRWQDFPHRSRSVLGSTSLLFNGYLVSFSWVKQPGRGVNHPPPSSAEVKERVELYRSVKSGSLSSRRGACKYGG